MNWELLEKLMNCFGVSGAEENICRIIAKEIKPFVNELSIDSIGNLIAHKKGKGPKVMLAAHMDEIGLMVKGIDEKGKIKVSIVGGLEPLVLISQRVFIKTDLKTINGIITTKEIAHDMKIKKQLSEEDIYIETGMAKQELEKNKLEVGNYVSLAKTIQWLGRNRIAGKALDDRVGCFVLIELAKKLKKLKLNNELFFVFTVQEEVGLYGAKTSAYSINPNWAIVVDVTNTDDGTSGSEKYIGKGPTVTLKDPEFIANKHINERLEEIAKRKKINIQWDVTETGTTDAITISMSRAGVPSSVVGVAVENLHSTIGLAHVRDIEQAVTLLEELLKKPPKLNR